MEEKFSSIILFVKDNNEKSLSIKYKKKNLNISKSLEDDTFMKPKTIFNHIAGVYNLDLNKYNVLFNCSSAGIIPYTKYNNKLLFLFQHSLINNKKNAGWNDFGGKRLSKDETTAQTASREFSEETSCLFYFKEKNDKLYDIFKNNINHEETIINSLIDAIPKSQEYYENKITEYVVPLFINSKETYISYLLEVPWIPEEDIPNAEDIHIPYHVRYLRECRWFSYEEIINLNITEFHKRLQITNIKNKIISFYKRGLF